MLDPTHPRTKHICRASSIIDSIMARGQQMTVSPSSIRATLLEECLPLFAQLRELNRIHFGDAVFIAQAINAYETGIRNVASLGNGLITEDRRDGNGDCPYCGTPIAKHPNYSLILCIKCDELFMVAKEELSSSEGFGTVAI